jgi:diguanylate cyclase (GGDEF)-like protein
VAKSKKADGGSGPTIEHITSERDYYRHLAVNRDREVAVLRSLLQSGKGFSEILEIEPLLSTFMAVCRERCGMTRSTVLLKDDLDPHAVTYRVRAYHGLPEQFTDDTGAEEEMLLFRIPADTGLLWQQILQGDVFAVVGMTGTPHFRTAWERWNLGVLQAQVWCPLIKGGDVLGVLTLGGGDRTQALDTTELLFLQEICAVAATNMDSTLKYGKNLKILANLQTLYDINQELANLNDFKALTRKTLQSAVHAMGAQKANLMLLNRSTGDLEIKLVDGDIPEATKKGINNGDIRTRTFKVGEGNAGMAALQRKPIRVNHRSRITQVGRNPVHCILSVPLIHGNEVIGVMNMTNKVRPADPNDPDSERVLDALGMFTETDCQLALGLADQAAVNLHKARLYDAAVTDRMTGLKNTRHFEDCLATALIEAEAQDTTVTLAITDLDHFKHFNDTYGHKAGDLVLKATAKQLETIASAIPGAIAFRYGGEEFCVLMRDITTEQARAHLDVWRQQIEAMTMEYDGKPLKVTASVGICEYPRHCARPEALFVNADAALYRSKDAGRNRVTCHGDPIQQPEPNVKPV